MMCQSDKTKIAIVGMHASGTSFVAKWLYESGFFLGNNLIEANKINPNGHFEEKSIVEFHKNILKINGFNPSGLIFLNENVNSLKVDSYSPYFDFFDSSNSDKIAFKDPRTTLFLSTYKNKIPELRTIIVIRSPEATIQSLYNRIYTHNWNNYLENNQSDIRKLYSFIKKQFNKQKWVEDFLNSYLIYYKLLLKHYELYKESSFIINYEDFGKHNINLKSINTFCNSELSNFDRIYQKKGTNKSRLIRFNDFDSFSKCLELYNKLNSFQS